MLTAISLHNPAFINTLSHASGLVLVGGTHGTGPEGLKQGPNTGYMRSVHT
jgi:hypothetical protein